MLLPTSSDTATREGSIDAVSQLRNWELKASEGPVRTVLLISGRGMMRSRVGLLAKGSFLHTKLPDE